MLTLVGESLNTGRVHLLKVLTLVGESLEKGVSPSTEGASIYHDSLMMSRFLDVPCLTEGCQPEVSINHITDLLAFI